MKKLKWKKLKGTGYVAWVSEDAYFKITKLNSDRQVCRLRVNGEFINRWFKNISTAKKVAQTIHNG